MSPIDSFGGRIVTNKEFERIADYLASHVREHASADVQATVMQQLELVRDGSLHWTASRRREQALARVIDSLIPGWGNLSLSGAHGYVHSFADAAILKVYGAPSGGVVHDKNVDGYAFSVINNKAVMLQPVTRACTATAMLLHDAGAHIDVRKMRRTNIGNKTTMISAINEAGFATIISKNSTIDELAPAIMVFGPAIVSLNSGVDGHVVVVDAIEERSVRLRDPAHGWMIDVRREAFTDAVWGGDVRFGRLPSVNKCLHLGERGAAALRDKMLAPGGNRLLSDLV